MPSFIHIADTHFDTAFSANFDAKKAKIRRAEMLQSFSNVIEYAKNVDFLLIAGDVFDGDYVSSDTINFLKRKFSEISDKKVFICAGNHDPYKHQSIYDTISFGENVYVFKTEPEFVEIPECKTRIYGVSMPERACSVMDGFPSAYDNEYTNIILAHGDIVSSVNESEYNPITKSFIENCGADYLALGHIHKRSEIEKIGNTYYSYPGVIEGRGFDECGDMGCYIINIEDGLLNYEFKKTCVRRNFRLEVDVNAASDIIEIADIVKKEMSSVGNEKDIYRIYLTGRRKSNINTEVIENEIKGNVFHFEVYDETKPDYNLKEIRERNSLCGEFVRLMEEDISALSGIDKENAENALLLGIEALLGGDIS